jgi:hypothetical protein
VAYVFDKLTLHSLQQVMTNSTLNSNPIFESSAEPISEH